MARVDKSKRVNDAVAAIKRGEFTDYSAAARVYGCDRTAISKRIRLLTRPRKEADSFWRQCLTDAQEEILIDRINNLSMRQMPPTSHIVKNLAEELCGRTVGKNWVGQFIKRHKGRLHSMYLRNIDNLRVAAEYAPMFYLFFDRLEQVIEKYNITAENIYNFDEKGFMIGIARMLKRVMTIMAMSKLGGMRARQDGNREFISLLACISAIGKVIPSLLIYKGKNGDLQTSWLEDVTEDCNTYFTSSENGWSSKKIGLAWLKEIFERHTNLQYPQISRTRRLLIVDGHSSHVNFEFINWADTHHIIVLILPPHSTHKLQPLDVGMFGNLSTQYSMEMNRQMSSADGVGTQMSKRFFFKTYKIAFDIAFTEKAIQHAFEKPGIWPIDRTIWITRFNNISKLKYESTNEPRTPQNAPQIRIFRKLYEYNPTVNNTRKLFKALEQAQTDRDIALHENKGLREQLVREQRKHKKGKRLDLEGELDTGTICYSPAKMVRVRIYQEVKEAEKLAEEERLTKKRVIRAANALIRERKRLQQEGNDAASQLVKELLAENPISEQTPFKESKSKTTKAKSASSKASKSNSEFKKAKTTIVKNSQALKLDLEPQVEERVVVGTNSRGRQIVLPQRFA